GLVWVGTNNVRPGKPAFKEDAGVLACFRAADGKPRYRYVAPRLGKVIHDWPHSSLACAPLAEGDRLWFTTNRCETVCLDVGPLRRGAGAPRVLWKVDMIRELGVFPHGNLMGLGRHSSPAGYRHLVYVLTGNGVDENHLTVPAPRAPSLVCFHKDTGKVVW